jgi:hypothetical protein
VALSAVQRRASVSLWVVSVGAFPRCTLYSPARQRLRLTTGIAVQSHPLTPLRVTPTYAQSLPSLDRTRPALTLSITDSVERVLLSSQVGAALDVTCAGSSLPQQPRVLGMDHAGYHVGLITSPLFALRRAPYVV